MKTDLLAVLFSVSNKLHGDTDGHAFVVAELATNIREMAKRYSAGASVRRVILTSDVPAMDNGNSGLCRLTPGAAGEKIRSTKRL